MPSTNCKRKTLKCGMRNIDLSSSDSESSDSDECRKRQRGPPGNPGPPGLNGADGQDGKDGVDGVDGAPGKDGVDGAPGKDGVDGAPGLNGADGQDGKDGVDGAPGKDGADGKDGVDGKDGEPFWHYIPVTEGGVVTDITLAPNPAAVGAPVTSDFLVPLSAQNTEGPGTRLFFDQSKGAIRAGAVDGTQWDDGNRGQYSVVFGVNNTAFGNLSTVTGGAKNVASAKLSFVGGGGDDIFSGYENIASGERSVIVGGSGNRSSGYCSSIVGGLLNNSTNTSSTIGGGTGNNSSGIFSTIPGGYSNSSGGNTSFAAGNYANDGLYNNTFVWGSEAGLDVGTVAIPFNTTRTNNGVWYSVASGTGGSTSDIGYMIYTNPTKTSGVYLTRGGSSWAAFSDKNLKENIEEVKTTPYLDKVVKLPIFTYNYKGNPSDQVCVGPMAQDWHELFPSSKPNGGIESADIDGVLLACVKELYTLVQNQTTNITNITNTISHWNNGKGPK